MKKVLISSYSNLRTDLRIQRQIRALKEKYSLITAGLESANNHPEIPFVKLDVSVRPTAEKIRTFFDYENRYWDDTRLRDYNKLVEHSYDLVIANDVDTLPLAVRLKKDKGCRIYFDAHEYHPLEFDDNFLWRATQKKFKTYLCREYLRYADRMSTVSQGIAEEYKKVFGVSSMVIRNASAYMALEPRRVNTPIRLVHHGGAMKERNLDLMMDVAAALGNDYTLTFILIPSNKRYIAELKEKAKSHSNVFFEEPVSQDVLASKLNTFDIGIYLLKPTSFNNKFALPNKIFDFIQARLCIAIAPSPEMADLIRRYNLGVISNDFTVQTLKQAILSLSREQIYAYKLNAHKSARELSSDAELEKIRGIVQDALK
jgi:hypothetical protein